MAMQWDPSKEPGIRTVADVDAFFESIDQQRDLEIERALRYSWQNQDAGRIESLVYMGRDIAVHRFVAVPPEFPPETYVGPVDIVKEKPEEYGNKDEIMLYLFQDPIYKDRVYRDNVLADVKAMVEIVNFRERNIDRLTSMRRAMHELFMHPAHHPCCVDEERCEHCEYSFMAMWSISDPQMAMRNSLHLIVQKLQIERSKGN